MMEAVQSHLAMPESRQPADMPLLAINNLSIGLAASGRMIPAVEECTFELMPGQVTGLVGESGSGKSITALALIGLLKEPMRQISGEIIFEGRRIDTLDPDERRDLRGRKIAMIFQEPMTALNPLSPVGRQIAEMYVLHQGLSWRTAKALAVDALASVKVPAPARRALDYPHQLSGGMRQRVMIAMALACRPKLLIADEPTTALDVTVQAQVMDLMLDLCRDLGTAILLISHDLGLIGQTCDKVAVMYGGRIMESGAASDVLASPKHPYTVGLINSLPHLGSRSEASRVRLTEIPGVVPTLGNFPAGCPFSQRCGFADDRCHTMPLPWHRASDRLVRCHRHG